MKTRSKIICGSLALLIAGSSLLYITPASIVKAESSQNVSSSLQTSTQSDRAPVKKAIRDALQLGYPEYSLTFLRVVKLGVIPLG